ncbi:tumor necrosis factor receptor superfamily member 14-like isoform X3 [Thunnus albacares]|nr:tumor necrosis factor receptor superfamily member 14-like isoform X3 [Thunnus albacares]
MMSSAHQNCQLDPQNDFEKKTFDSCNFVGNRVKTDCTEFRSTSCLPCTDGTYMNHPTGLKKCLTCANCDAGSGLQIKTSCTSTSNTVCQPLEGFYCMDSTEDGCVKALKHTSCQPGQYIRQKGTSSTDTVCYNCQPGYFSQDGVNCTAWTICSETEVMVKEGNQTNDVVCRSSSRNHYSLISPLLMVFSLTLAWLVSRGETLVQHRNETPLFPTPKNHQQQGLQSSKVFIHTVDRGHFGFTHNYTKLSTQNKNKPKYTSLPVYTLARYILQYFTGESFTTCWLEVERGGSQPLNH